ncbi:hypothetical protein D9756_005734 [Leucocoprinus leucothites]|uniref:CFEM domain-containing protein n=1 Tax=Leucocoprinus leucothites TaxID=201217 RepID=A0A8H5G096_9AGAR|nr:hypothetical protein D9756_005734 [Leucoagaricus leucothites]
MHAKLLSLFVLVPFVFAQTDSTTTDAGTGTDSATPTGTGATPSGSGIPGIGSLPPCIQDCITSSATTANCEPTSAECLCNPDFITAATTCAQSCTAEEQQAALALEQSVCAGGGTSGSGIPTAPGPVSGTSITGSATVLPTSGTSRTNLPSATTPRATSTGSGTVTGSGASTSTTNAAVPDAAAQGLWAMAAGLLGVAVAF